MFSPNTDAMKNILINIFKLAMGLSKSKEPIVWELGHYLADNLISKICIYVAFEKKNENLIYKNVSNKWTKDFPRLYQDILMHYYPNVPDYDTVIKSHHSRRNVFQHSETSLEMSIRREFVNPYLELTQAIMKEISLIDNNTDLDSSPFLVEHSLPMLQLREIPTGGLNPNDPRIEMLKNLIKNFLILHYTPNISHNENAIIKNIVEILCKYDSNYREDYLRPDASRPKYGELISKFFKINMPEIFSKKVISKEIILENFHRNINMHAGDLSLIFYYYYEKYLRRDKISVDTIRQQYELELKEYGYFKENYRKDLFKESLRILWKEYGVISLSEEYNGSDSPAEAEIINSEALLKIAEHFSINFYLKKVKESF